VSKFDTSQIQWREPWLPASPEQASQAEAELPRELCAGHVLFGRSVTAIGVGQDCDDVLFYLGESAPSFAVVHLTFQRETQPRWPDTELFDSLAAW
jgi:hypothetical protein